MMRGLIKPLLIFILMFAVTPSFGQHSIEGNIFNNRAAPLGYATVALLSPNDSTLEYFAVTDVEGFFVIKSIKAGKYLLQSAYLGFSFSYREIDIPLESGSNAGTIIMQPSAVNLGEAEIMGERIPILLKKDTVEYNAGSFKTRPDAATEDLLKKLPGVEVDRAGNIRAQGEDVKQVLVDGKEFFGNDPKVATKNIPADAIDKVQVYDKKSDEAEMTGIDDGSRSKTVNLLLKDDRKGAWLGDIQAGGGTGPHYQASAKAYRFTKESQFAALGMYNNINKFGFTFSDYMEFNGGFKNMMEGGEKFNISLGDENSLPVDFGQQVTGLITSGAGGLNYTYERKKDNRFNISYLANGADKKKYENVSTAYFIPGNTFTTEESYHELTKSRIHSLNTGWRNRIDSMQSIVFSGSAGLSSGSSDLRSYTQSFTGDTLLNDLAGSSGAAKHGMNGKAHGAYLKKFAGKWKLLKASADVSSAQSLNKTQWQNISRYFITGDQLYDNRFLDTRNSVLKYSFTASVTRSLFKNAYLEPELKAGRAAEHLRKEQRISEEESVIDSLSLSLSPVYQWVRPGLRFRASSDKARLIILARVESMQQLVRLNGLTAVNNTGTYFTPTVIWEYEYNKTHRFMGAYESFLDMPSASQLMPVAETNNPLQVFTGNMHLKPAQVHDAHIHWVMFDQFSFTSLFAGIRGTYTKDKISMSRNVSSGYAQSVTLVNVKDDYNAEVNVEFSAPIRKLGITTRINATEGWNRGINFVNGNENIITGYTTDLTLSFSNRKKEKWDATIGAAGRYNSARYSVEKRLNQDFFNYSGFADITFSPGDRWSFSASADITHYHSPGNGSVNVPLLKASVTRYILKANRGVITLEGFDLLNRNTGVERISELNYLQQKQSGIIKRYFMLSFKYRLSKFDNSNSVDVQVNGK